MKKQFTQRIPSVILAGLMLSSVLFVGCTSGGRKTGDTGSETKSPVSTDSGSKELDYSDRSIKEDGLPAEYAMNGFTIRFLTREGFEEEITLNDTGDTSDVVDNVIYTRQRALEERFGCKIEKIVEPQNPTAFLEKIRTSVSTDDNAFHLAIGHIDYVAALAPDGYLAKWQDMPYVDFSKPWWNRSANDSLTIGGNSFFALGDINYTLIHQCNCIYFNKQLVEDYKIDDPYQTVLDGKWTLDYLSELTKKNYTDLNHNDKRDIDDFYTYTVDVHSGLNSYQNAAECLMYKKNSDDIPEFYANTKRMSNLVDKMYSILYKNEGTFAAYEYSYAAEDSTVYWWEVGQKKFLGGTTIYTHGWLGNATNVYRQFPGEYGIIPLPKYDEKQTDYHTMMDASGPFMCIPRTIHDEDIDNVGMITEAMAAYGYKKVTPVVFDEALKIKYSSLEGSGQMLDMIMEGLTFDFGYVHSSDYHNILRKVLVNKDSSLTHYLNSAGTALKNHYDKIIDAYLQFDLE